MVPDFDKNGGFIEIQTQTHKTAKTASNKTVLLSIVVPVVGVTGDLWVQQAIEAFSAVGLGFAGATLQASSTGWIRVELQAGDHLRGSYKIFESMLRGWAHRHEAWQDFISQPQGDHFVMDGKGVRRSGRPSSVGQALLGLH